MSFDVPQMHLPDNSPEAQIMEAIISREHVTPEEVVRMALRRLTIPHRPAKRVAPNKGQAQSIAPLTEAEMQYLDQMFPALDALDDVTDEQWGRIDKNVRRMKQARLSTRA